MSKAANEQTAYLMEGSHHRPRTSASFLLSGTVTVDEWDERMVRGKGWKPGKGNRFSYFTNRRH